MADITEELKNIAQAEAGEHVRWSIHDGIKKINDGTMVDNAENLKNLQIGLSEGFQGINESMNAATEIITGIANEAKETSASAVSTAEEALGAANRAISSANEAKETSASAVSTAEEALKLINDAIAGEGGAEALEVANEAKRIAEEALGKAESAESTAQEALDKIGDWDSSIIIPDFSGINKNSIFRGKYLGNAVTQAQRDAIKNGTFDDLYLGDYWKLADKNFVIMGFNTFSGFYSENHVVIMSSALTNIAFVPQNNDKTKGFLGSNIISTVMSSVLHYMTDLFGTTSLKNPWTTYDSNQTGATNNYYVTGQFSAANNATVGEVAANAHKQIGLPHPAYFGGTNLISEIGCRLPRFPVLNYWKLVYTNIFYGVSGGYILTSSLSHRYATPLIMSSTLQLLGREIESAVRGICAVSCFTGGH